MKSLFKEEHKIDAARLGEIQNSTLDSAKSKKEKTTVSRLKYNRLNRKLIETKEQLHYVLHQIEPVSNRFGKDFLKIEITREEWARFKQIFKDS